MKEERNPAEEGMKAARKDNLVMELESDIKGYVRLTGLLYKHLYASIEDIDGNEVELESLAGGKTPRFVRKWYTHKELARLLADKMVD